VSDVVVPTGNVGKRRQARLPDLGITKVFSSVKKNKLRSSHISSPKMYRLLMNEVANWIIRGILQPRV
jgi:hypothetical protein